MGSSSIELSLANIWNSWQKFRKGKRRTRELEHFQYFLEKNLQELYVELNNGKYRHGSYSKFIVVDNKRREISVASIKDRIVHRLLYENLTEIYDKIFIFDAWSYRKGKGLIGAIERAQKFLNKYSHSFVWRSDIKKFFDNVDHEVLIRILSLRISDNTANWLFKKVIESYSVSEVIRERERERERERKRESKTLRRKGIPIGNLTSQIFANIYLNELDRFTKHIIKPQAYLRYGDDFIIISNNLNWLNQKREEVIKFLDEKLGLEINTKNDIMIKAKQGLKFLGVEVYPKGRRLNRRNWQRAKSRLNLQNTSSYSGLVKKHSKIKRIKEFNWIVSDKLNKEIG